MRSLDESITRWQETVKHSSSLTELQQVVKFNGPNSPCIAGCRSICWKAFLLGYGSDTKNWSHVLLESRSTYASLRDHFLKYIKHPEYLATVSVDPLADDANSPWNTSRQDEILRSEILQDVQRLPDEPFYHEPHIQTLILDVLFIYCKLNPDIGGYRQGMHELLAPIVYVVEQDAIDPADTASEGSADLTMVEMLDAAFIEHDSFALFSKVMDHAKSFYENGDGLNGGQSAIVEKSQHIHEVLLHKVDPDLSNHLKHTEILPQIFLIRWIRLLFSREFPFDQMLAVWDTLFSVDPSFQLIDFICTAMLIRIRWQLLEADYSVALQLLLKYPSPQEPHGPHTFVNDAVYLRDHLTPDGGSTLTLKYTGKLPASPGISSRPSTPRQSGLGLHQNARGARSPLLPSRFIQQQGGVEALFQGAARGVLERGEKLGINQAVRDAMLEIRRNVNEARTSIKTGRDLFSEPSPRTTAMLAVAAMDRRNRQLSSMLDETLSSLRELTTTTATDDKQQRVETLEIAVAKIQFVKIYLEDSTLMLPEDQASPSESTTPQPQMIAPEPPADALAAMVISTPDMVIDSTKPPQEFKADPNPDAMQTGPLSSSKISPPDTNTLQRPQAPIPTRSTLAQSSFSWMLEPDESSSSFKKPVSSSKPRASSAHRKKPSLNATRERTAFLFGEASPDSVGQTVLPEDIFGLQPLSKGKG